MYRLLVVDDEANEREGLHYLVSNYHLPFSVTEASNGRDALAKFDIGCFDCLITDIKMPFMDGLLLCEEVQSKSPDTVKIIYSAHSDFKYAKKAIQIRVDDYILKPIIPDDFYNIMTGIADRLGNGDNPQSLGSLASPGEPGREAAPQDADTQKRIIRQVKEYIHNNYQSDISLDKIAGEVYLSTGYLSSLFKRETKKNIVQYVTLLRMAKAREMLLGSNIPVSKVGQAVGYGNTSYFCLLFRKHYGITAQQMREGAAYEATT